MSRPAGFRPLALCLAACAVACIGYAPAGALRQQGAAALPDVRIEYIGACNGYATGTDPVDVLCVLHNFGAAALPDGTLRVRCYTFAGLDYTSGDTRPVLPAIPAGGTVFCRWRLAPSETTGPLIVGAILSSALPTPGPSARASSQSDTLAAPSPIAIRVIPRLAGSAWIQDPWPPPTAPVVLSRSARAWIGNDRACVALARCETGEPVAILKTRLAAGWHQVAVVSPLARVRSGEPGQRPWWQTLHWERATATRDKDAASLTVTGDMGGNWRAELTLAAERNTCVIHGTLRLTALRPVQMDAVDLATLTIGPTPASQSAAPGQPVFVDDPVSPLTPDDGVTAVWSGGTTIGVAWPPGGPFTDWTWSPLRPVGGISIAGAVGRAPGRPAVVPAGASLQVKFRLFALQPSASAGDARRFRIPADRQ